MNLRYAALLAAILATPMLAQIATPSTPQLTAAEKIAIQSIEAKKAEYRNSWEEANKAEAQVIADFAASHPGWKLNPQTFAVEGAEKPEERNSYNYNMKDHNPHHAEPAPAPVKK